jgi:hypothetical protein
LSLQTFSSPILTFPGCWSKPENEQVLLNSVHWRFCGAFFLGDAGSLLNFCKLHKEHFYLFLEKYNTLIWDFNFWSYLELTTGWSPTWYKADHNDSIFYICPDNHVSSLSELYFSSKSTKNLRDSTERSVEEDQIAVTPESKNEFCENEVKIKNEIFYKVTYNYPEFNGFIEKKSMDSPERNVEESINTELQEKYHPMSASYLYDPSTNKHWLSTRYVNYWIYPNGNYHFYNKNHLINSENFLTALIETNISQKIQISSTDNFSTISDLMDLTFSPEQSVGESSERSVEEGKNEFCGNEVEAKFKSSSSSSSWSELYGDKFIGLLLNKKLLKSFSGSFRDSS